MAHQTHTSKQPFDVLRDGSLKATLWENEGQNGPFLSVTLSKTYEDRNGDLQDGNSFAGGELLRIAELARIAHMENLEYRNDLKAEPSEPDYDEGKSLKSHYGDHAL